MIEFDLSRETVRTLNSRLHHLPADTNERAWRIVNPRGAHSIAVGLTQPLDVTVEGHAGYYCGGMNQQATITVRGQCVIRVEGNASQSAGASGRGGLLVITGDASARCGISMKGVDIVVGGGVGHLSCFMGQAGALVVCGDADHDLGDSLYEAEIFVAGKVASLGADCIEKEMERGHEAKVAALLERARLPGDPKRFRRYGSARKLYNFHIDHAGQY
jgi:glutamate synthase domain-containing protein 3